MLFSDLTLQHASLKYAFVNGLLILVIWVVDDMTLYHHKS